MPCCNENGCRRSEPLRIYRGITGRWYVATRSNGETALTKHALPDEAQTQLTEMADAAAWLAAIEAAVGGRQQILDALNLDIRVKP
jgi:hypothetical protein